MPYVLDRAPQYQLRHGIDTPGAQGMNTEWDAASVPAEQFARLENVKFQGNRLLNRDGLAKVNSGGAMTGNVTGISEEAARAGVGDGVAAGRGTRLYLADGRLDSTLIVVDSALSTSPQQFSGVTLDYYGPMYVHSDGTIYCSQKDSTTYYLASMSPAVVPTPAGTVQAYQRQPARLCRIPVPTGGTSNGGGSDGNIVVSITGLGSDIFVGVYDQTTNTTDGVRRPTVFKYDPGTNQLSSDDYVEYTYGGGGAVTGSVPYVFTYREQVLAVYDGKSTDTWEWAGSVRVRSSAGTWSTVTAPSDAYFTPGAIATDAFDDAAEWNGKLYLSFENRLVSWDGSTATYIDQLVGANIVERPSLAAHGDYLYFAYLHNNAGTYTVRLGRYDGTTITANYATILSPGNATSYPLRGGFRIQGTTAHLILSDGGSSRVYTASTSDLTTWTRLTQSTYDTSGTKQQIKREWAVL